MKIMLNIQKFFLLLIVSNNFYFFDLLKPTAFYRHDIIHRSELMRPEERQQFAKKIMTPLESIAKHLTDHSAIEEAKFEENQNSEVKSLPLTRYQEINLDDKNEKNGSLGIENDSEAYVDSYNEDDSIKEDTTVPQNHKVSVDEDYASTEKYEIDAQKLLIVTTEKDCANCDNTTVIDNPKADTNKSIDLPKDIDTTEGSQPRRFNHDLPR